MFRILTPAAAVLAAAALIAGCGGSNNNGTGASTSSRNFHNAGLKMAQCMRANGVPSFPDPSSNGGGGAIGIQPGSNGTVKVGGVSVAQSALQAAFQKCRKELPQGPPISSAQLARIRQGALRMAECMRSHGVPNFPDPQITTGPGGHGVGIRIGGGPNGPGGKSGPPAFTRSPAFQSAQKTCGSLIGKPPAAGPGG